MTNMKTPQNFSPVVVVTGGARGIGLEICNTFLKRGYRVAALDKDKETLAKTEAHFNSPDFLAVHCDVSKPMQVTRSIDRIAKKFGRIDSLVNNAGVAIFKPILEVTWQDWRSIMSTNLDGAFWCTQACAKLMLKNGGGSIVNIASISGLRASTLRVSSAIFAGSTFGSAASLARLAASFRSASAISAGSPVRRTVAPSRSRAN